MTDNIYRTDGNYLSIVENSPDYIVRYDRQFRHLYMNKAGLSVAGTDRDNIIGKTHKETGIFEPEQCKYWEEKLEYVFETGKPHREQFEWVSANGPVWLDWLLTPEFDEDGNIISVLGVSRDISHLKTIEKALLESESRFRVFFDQAPLGYQSLDSAGRFIDVNQAWLDTLGYKRNEVIGKWFGDFLTPLHREGFVRRFPLFKAKGKIHSEFEMLTKKGEIIIIAFDGRIGYDINGDFQRTHCVLKDVTEQRKAEEALRTSEEIFSHFMEHSPIFVFFKDAEIRSLRLSKNYEQMLGRPLNELLGKTMDDLFPSDLAKKMIADDIRILNEGKPETIEEEFNGKQYFTIKFPIVVDGKPTYLAGYTIDITDQKRAEEEIANLNKDLENKVIERTRLLEATNKELESFAYSVSHDLRAPLRAIDGFSKFLLDDHGSKLDPEGKRLLGLIRNNTKRMDQLIQDVLALSRVTRREQKASNTDMAKIALAMYNELDQSDLQMKVRFTIDPLPEAYVDPTYIKLVWFNLISNAVKFSSTRPHPEIKIGGYTENNFNIYFIKDNGVGFNMDYSHKLFGVFQRLHKPEDFEGTGVGLAIVNRIINRHQGKTWAEAKENEGATFYFSIPVNEGPVSLKQAGKG